MDGAPRDADEALVALYSANYRPLVRLATFLLHGDRAVAEEAVQDAFVSMHGAWRRLRDPGMAEPYLRQAVVNNCRSRHRRRQVEQRHAEPPPADAASAEYGAMASLERRDVVAALHALPQRQREVLVLRYYAGLSEAEIARTLGISNGAVKSHASRGMSALRVSLEQLS